MDNKNSLHSPNGWTSDMLHGDLLASKELIYDKCGFICSQPYEEAQNAEYGAYVFTIRFRVAKTTPTKIGQFVTLWQRSEDGSTQPNDGSDSADVYVISTRIGSHFGQFVFPKHVLLQRDILSDQGKGGKRAIRVYPPWDKPTSKQALKTQQWQLEYFLEVPFTEPLNCDQARVLYGTKRLK
ncbi:MepB domain containing protein [Paenibacillus sp. BGI2013]|uniref:MepB family protein n=1 Tax=Paenibacillus TaxID=44249 RepID=UPI00096E688C|nr:MULTISPECIES: MepB family protein [Paenibacillus]OMF43323.1 MepB domain containing protein [Paenibacillus amylolyticus]PKQ87841.1 MepB domain containing protein [Paenibacillus sp. BGI2013]